MKEEGRGFIASNLRVWLCLRADPRKLKREIIQNPTSAKIATLEIFPLYGIYMYMLALSPVPFPIFNGMQLKSGNGTGDKTICMHQ